MPDDIKVPGLGDVPKKYVIGGVVVGGAIAVVVYVRARKASAAAVNQTAAQADGTVTDPAGNICSALDPNSGYCPGTPEDIAYQQQSGYYSSGGAGFDSGASGTSSASGTGSIGTGVITDTTGAMGTSTTPATNSDWIQSALQVLPGGDTSANEAALAGVLGGLTVTTAQKNIFLEAVGLIGQPPAGYPTPIKTSDTAQQPGTPSRAAGRIVGLSVVPSGSGIQAKWGTSTGATGGYSWALTGPQSKSGTTTGHVVTVHNLAKGTYNFGIQALPGGQGDNAHVTVG